MKTQCYRNYCNHKTEILCLIVFLVTVPDAVKYMHISDFLIANCKNVLSFEVFVTSNEV